MLVSPFELLELFLAGALYAGSLPTQVLIITDVRYWLPEAFSAIAIEKLLLECNCICDYIWLIAMRHLEDLYGLLKFPLIQFPMKILRNFSSGWLPIIYY